jgi:hypothetical protein
LELRVWSLELLAWSSGVLGWSLENDSAYDIHVASSSRHPDAQLPEVDFVGVKL